MAKSTIRVSALMDLASLESDTAHEYLTKVYEWRHERMTTVARALTGSGLALALTPLLPILQPEQEAPLEWGWVVGIWAAAGVQIGVGAGSFVAGRRLHTEFLAAQQLLGELTELRPFLRKYQEER